MKVVII